MTAFCGPAASVNILGCAMFFLKGIHLVSIIGNVGTLNKTVIEVDRLLVFLFVFQFTVQILVEPMMMYHCLLLIPSFFGLLIHPFFYAILVSYHVNQKKTSVQELVFDLYTPRDFSLIS